jgi:membrane-bound lytic murein transglycosylase D
VAESDKPAPKQTSPSSDDLYALGKALFDEYAPEEIKRDYEFPSKKQWDEFVAKLEKAMQGDSMAELAELEPQARAALKLLDAIPQGSELADWLRERLDMIEAAKQLVKYQPPTRPEKPGVTRPSPPSFLVPHGAPAIPNYELWVSRLRDRPLPENAAELMPVLRRAFALEGVPADLAWIAEVESTLNPSARSPVGAKGLFQLMPETAKGLGLSTWMPDERTHPEKSARAAARFLNQLHAEFGDWPLALAAYNAGGGRVRRTLEKQGGKSFSDIAAFLPVETRFYVPKVLATVSMRTGSSSEKLAAFDGRHF